MLPSDVLVALALLLAVAGRPAEAASVVEAAAPGGLLVEQPDIALALAGLFRQSQRPAGALAFADPRPDAPEHARIAAEVLRMPALWDARELGHADADQLEAQLRAVIDIESNQNCPEGVGSGWYTLATFLRLRWRVDEAVTAYDAAAEKGKPPYRERGYFHRERAGMLFEAGRYAEAAGAYREALSLGNDGQLESRGEIQTLLADALMLAGQYRQAYDTFRATPWTRSRWGTEWRLKQLALEHLLAILGVDAQQRDPLPANAVPHGWMTPQAADRLLSADALDPRAWLALAVQRSEASDDAAAFRSLLIAATVTRDSARGWLLALATAISSGAAASTIADVVHAALFFCRDEFTELAESAEEHLGDDGTARSVRAALFEHGNTAPRRREVPAIRVAQHGWRADPVEDSDREKQ